MSETYKVLQFQDPVVGSRSVGLWRTVRSSVEQRKRALDEGGESRTLDRRAARMELVNGPVGECSCRSAGTSNSELGAYVKTWRLG